MSVTAMTDTASPRAIKLALCYLLHVRQSNKVCKEVMKNVKIVGVLANKSFCFLDSPPGGPAKIKKCKILLNIVAD
jgi:hypothetical protein